MSRRPMRVRAVAVVIYDDETLLVESKHSPGSWVPPGGRVESREALHEAAVREVAEETGVQVETAGMIAYRELWWGEEDLLEFYFAARPFGESAGWAGSGPEGRPAKWVRLEDLDSLQHYPLALHALCRLAQEALEGPELVAWHMGTEEVRE